MRLIKTSELDRNRNYLVCSHPHGVLSAGAFACFGTNGRDVSKVIQEEAPGSPVLSDLSLFLMSRSTPA